MFGPESSDCKFIVYSGGHWQALAESSVVFGRVFGNKMGRRLTVVEKGLFSDIATSTVQVSTQGIRSHVHYRSQVI